MKRILKLTLYAVIGFFVFLTGQTIGEHIAIQQEIRQFVQKGVLDEVNSTDTVKYYIVSRETYYPNELVRTPFYESDFTKPGDAGDIFVTQTSPLAGFAGIHEFVSFFFGGHAAVIDEQNMIYETIGIPNSDENLFDVMLNGGEDTKVTGGIRNYWLNPTFRSVNENDPNYLAYGTYYRKSWIGLRLKGVTESDITTVMDYLEDKEQKEAQYNYWFVFNTNNRYYCTDMVSRAYEAIKTPDGNQKYHLNKDGIAVTVNDLVLSKNTYISYYVTTDKNDVKHVYYIG